MADGARVRLGVIASSEGGLIDALARIGTVAGGAAAGPFDLAGIVTDRPCGAEDVAAQHGIPLRRIAEPDREPFSAGATETFVAWETDVVLLLFLRVVSPALWHDFVGAGRGPAPHAGAVWNLHPSLLPRYRGLGALRRSWLDAIAPATRGDAALGVTLHVADDDPDGGAVLGQARFRVADAPSLAHAAHLCFLQKLALILEAGRACAERTLAPTPQAALDGVPWRGAYRGLHPADDVTRLVRAFARPWARRWLDRLAGRRPEPVH